MNLQETGIKVLELIVAGIPALIALISMHRKNNRNFINKVEDFNIKVDKSEKKTIDKIDDKVNAILNNVDKRFEKTVDKVDMTLDETLKVVEGFSNKLTSVEHQLEHTAKSNIVAFEIISVLLGGNEKLIANGTSKVLLNKINLTQEELKHFPELLSTNKEVFIQALKEQMALLGEEEFNKLILEAKKGTNYGKKYKENEEEKLQD